MHLHMFIYIQHNAIQYNIIQTDLLYPQLISIHHQLFRIQYTTF